MRVGLNFRTNIKTSFYVFLVGVLMIICLEMINLIQLSNLNYNCVSFKKNIKYMILSSLNDTYNNVVFFFVFFFIFIVFFKKVNLNFFWILMYLIISLNVLDCYVNIKFLLSNHINYFEVNLKLTNNWLLLHPIFIHISYGLAVVCVSSNLIVKFSKINNLLSYFLINNVMNLIFISTTISLFLGIYWAVLEVSWINWWSWDIIEASLLIIWYRVFITFHGLFFFKHKIKMNSYLILLMVLILNLVTIRYDLSFSIHNFNVLHRIELVVGLILIFFFNYFNINFKNITFLIKLQSINLNLNVLRLIENPHSYNLMKLMGYYNFYVILLVGITLLQLKFSWQLNLFLKINLIFIIVGFIGNFYILIFWKKHQFKYSLIFILLVFLVNMLCFLNGLEYLTSIFLLTVFLTNTTQTRTTIIHTIVVYTINLYLVLSNSIVVSLNVGGYLLPYDNIFFIKWLNGVWINFMNLTAFYTSSLNFSKSNSIQSFWKLYSYNKSNTLNNTYYELIDLNVIFINSLKNITSVYNASIFTLNFGLDSFCFLFYLSLTITTSLILRNFVLNFRTKNKKQKITPNKFKSLVLYGIFTNYKHSNWT